MDNRSQRTRASYDGNEHRRPSQQSPRPARQSGPAQQPYAGAYGRPETSSQYSRGNGRYGNAASAPRRSSASYRSPHDAGAHDAPARNAGARSAHGRNAGAPAASAYDPATRGAAHEGAPRQMQGQGVALSREATAYSRNGADQYGKNRKPKKSRKKKVIITIVIVLLVLLAAAGGFAWWYLDKIADNLHEGVDEDALAELTPTQYDKEPFYLLLMGIDTSVERGGADYSTENARSDSMILARIDAPNKKVTMVSLHRDTVVDLGEHGMNKLNAARFYGGPALAIKKVSELAGVPISHYAELNFDAFSDMVDAVGGIEVEVPMEIDDPVLPAHLDAGWQTLYGADALVLCRSRHAYDAYGDGDRYRAANQRMVLGALAKKVLASDFLTIANTVQALSKYVTTDLDLGDIVGLAQLFRGMDPSRDIYSAMEPTTSSFENGGWYEYVDAVPWKAMMERVDQGLPPTEEDEVDSTGTVLATTGAGTIEALGGADADGYTHVPSEAIDDYGVGAPGA